MPYLFPILSTALVVFAARMMYLGWKKRVGDTDDEIAKARGKIGWYRQWGWALIIVAFANILKLEFPFPFPVVGAPSLYLSVLVGGAGLIFLTLYSLPKVNEVVMVAARTNGVVTEVLLMRELGLSERVIEATLRRMMQKELILPLNQAETTIPKLIFVVRGLAFPSPTRSSAARPAEQDSGQDIQADQASDNATVAPVNDDQIRQQYQNIADMGVDQVNQMLLMGSLTLGQSGRPVRGSGRRRRQTDE